MRLLFIVLITVFFVGCDSKKDDRLVISCNSWIGYSPFYYAKEQGWLDRLNIKLINVVSLGESMSLYDVGKSDAFTGTQYEYSVMKRKDKNLEPVMLLDRSYGGDMIFSNKSIEEIQNSDSKIDAYLEMGSVNSLLLKYFLEEYHVDKSRINYINKDQAIIENLKSAKFKSKTVLIVTYSPYDIRLKRNGFHEIACTKNGLTLVVVDALYTSKNMYETHKDKFIELKKAIDNAIEVMHKDPKKYYETVKPYLKGYTYDDFLLSLNEVKWINKDLSKELKQKLDSIEFPTEAIVK
ncbi:ABC transporter substrate-binding protein [Sulfurimonas sp. HSL3-2]|uniref:ABC transporter substrate-binding protein n=1 Tax=Hydrocurvibacter mobilis TaxID=3131936 RepID=UPI0031F9D455